MEAYKPGDLAALIAGAQSEETKEDLFKPKKKKYKAPEDSDEITPKRKKKRKSIVEDSAMRDLDTAQNAATPAEQKRVQKEDGASEEEASALEAERTSAKKKTKKRKSVVEDNAVGDVDTTQNDAPPDGQNCKHEKNGTPEEASAPEAEITPKKKKKRKSIVEESTTDVDAAQNVATPAGQEEDVAPPEEASAPEAERTSPKKKKKKRKSIVEDSAVDGNTTQNAASAEGQNFKHEENGVPTEEASAPETEITSPKKKKKKRKSIVEDNAVGDVDTIQTAAMPDEQNSKHEGDGIPPEVASPPETERTSKKKKRKSIVGDNTQDVNATQSAVTPTGQKRKQENDGDAPEEAIALEAERTSKKKKKRKSIMEDSIIEDLDIVQNTLTLEGQNCKQEDGVPPEEASPPEAKTSEKKKKRKSIMENSITEDLSVAQNAATLEGQNCKHIDGALPEEAKAPEAESVLSEEEKKKTAEDVSGATEENRDEIRKDENVIENVSLVTNEDGVKEEPIESTDAMEKERFSVPSKEEEKKKKKKKKKKNKKKTAEDVSNIKEKNVSLATNEAGEKEESTGSTDAMEATSVPSKKEKDEKKVAKDISDTIEENGDAVREDENVIEDVSLAINEAGEKEAPTERNDAMDTESALSKKKRKRKKKKKKAAQGVSGTTEENGSAVEDENEIDDVNLATTEAGLKEETAGNTNAMEVERSLPKKMIKSKKCSHDTQDVGGQGMDEETKGDMQENSSKEPDREDTSQEKVPKEVSRSGLKPSKKKLKKSDLQNKVTTGKESQNSTPLENGKDLSKQPSDKDKNRLTTEENKKSNGNNDKGTSGKPDIKEKKKLTANEKKLEKQKRITESIKNSLPTKHPEAEERTVFVGNVSIKTKRKMLAQFFKKYGEVETVRIRNVAVASPSISKKEAVATGKFHPKRTSLNAYIRFKKKESVEKALEANGVEFQEHHLIVNRSKKDALKKPENAVFVGNLPWEAEEESLYKHFIDCGAIESVRIIRDKKLGSGKGFGYVNFKSRDAMEVALQLSGKEFEGRALRVKRTVKKVKSKKDFGTKQKERVLPGQQPKMKLNFMKKAKGKQLEKEEFARKQKKIDFSGVKTSEGSSKKGKRMKFSKDDKRKAFIAQKLAGDGSSTHVVGPKSKVFPKSASSKPIKNDE